MSLNGSTKPGQLQLHYREMAVKFPGIKAASAEEAARLAFEMPTDKAAKVEDCEGLSHSALVDKPGDAEYLHSVVIDNPDSAVSHPAGLVALRACDLLVAAYAEGEERGGSVDWSAVDLAHEAALEARQLAPRPQKPAGFVQRIEHKRRDNTAQASDVPGSGR